MFHSKILTKSLPLVELMQLDCKDKIMLEPHAGKSKTVKTYTPTDPSDQQQPKNIFSLTTIDLLGAIVKGEIDPVQLAIQTLKNRGYNEDGFWVGF